jgi:hypothetical protein
MYKYTQNPVLLTKYYSGDQSRTRWTGHVACMGARRGGYRVSVEKPEGKNHLEDAGADGRIILR